MQVNIIVDDAMENKSEDGIQGVHEGERNRVQFQDQVDSAH